MASLAAGGAAGLLIGVGVGFAMYFGLLRIPMRHFFSATNSLLVLLAAGLASSAAGKLVQADALPTLVERVWDTSWMLSDESFLGHTLHILIGYTAQPSGIELLFYVATLAILLAGMRMFRLHPPNLLTAHLPPAAS